MNARPLMADEAERTRGGFREGAGRPPAENPKNVVFQIRLTADERAKLGRLGGAEWIRDRIKLAREPGRQQPKGRGKT